MDLHIFGPFLYLLAIAWWAYYMLAFIRATEPLQLEVKHTTWMWLLLMFGMVVYWVVRMFLGIVP